jgi:hypothetical protein
MDHLSDAQLEARSDRINPWSSSITRFGGPLALVIAVVALVWRRWVLPLVFELVALPLGAVVGRFTWEWFADRSPGFDFGSEFDGFDWVIGLASMASLRGSTHTSITAQAEGAFQRRRRSPTLAEQELGYCTHMRLSISPH